MSVLENNPALCANDKLPEDSCHNGKTEDELEEEIFNLQIKCDQKERRLIQKQEFEATVRRCLPLAGDRKTAERWARQAHSC